MLQQFLGIWSNSVQHLITQERTEKLSDVLKLGKTTISPTLPYTLDHGEIDKLPLPLPGLIHGSQKITYERPLKIGERITCQYCVQSFEIKQGKTGEIGIATLLYQAEDDKDQLIYTMVTQLILTKKYMERNLNDAN